VVHHHRPPACSGADRLYFVNEKSVKLVDTDGFARSLIVLGLVLTPNTTADRLTDTVDEVMSGDTGVKHNVSCTVLTAKYFVMYFR